jgi:hypothetical protein
MIGVNPYEYLKAVLAQLPATADAEVRNLTPAYWAKVHSPPKKNRESPKNRPYP